LIYNSGTFRTTFLSIIKVTTVFSFLGSLWVNAWPQVVVPDGSFFDAMRSKCSVNEVNLSYQLLTVAPIVAAISAVPPVVVHLFTHPYVATINLHLPRRARVSLSSLSEFSKELRPTTKLSITTVRPWGSAKVWELTVGDLEKVKPRLGRIENYVTKYGKQAFVGLGQRFYVGDVEKAEKNARVPGIWKQISKVIESGTVRKEETKKL
jgi:hypothetical protein